ncbi:hypothetical protein ACH4TV_36910 [Streptomyces sp. NPDC020898]|uniref:hypothetical protein n=1 Tax=Streptomyces sp. NPDC020898 TaxID=3365101 RepID=UPI0037B7BB24
MPEIPEVPEAQEAPKAPEAPARRRGRTPLLIATAALLGLVAGTCAGYLVQADREPTTLPPLSQVALAQAEGEGPEPLSAAQDRRVKTDGDLRKLLLKKPKGAKEAEYLTGEDGWMDLSDYAGDYDEPGAMFGTLLGSEFRRAAVTGWLDGDSSVEIRLVQFRQEETVAAAESAESGQYWAEQEEGTRSFPVPGTGDGKAYVHTEPVIELDSVSGYSAEAHAWRGDIALEVWVYDSKPISLEKIVDLAKRQMEQL